MSTEDDSRVKQLVEQVSNGVRQLEAQVLQLKGMIQSLQEESNKKPPDQNLLGKFDSLCAQMRTILLEQQQPGKKDYVRTRVNRIRLVYGGKQSDDGTTVADYNVENESRIDLVIRGRLIGY